MSPDDALYRYRVRVFALAEEMGSVRAACRAMGIHPSTFYRWRKLVRRGGLEMLRPRERRIPEMPNHTPVFVEQRVLAYALGHAGEGPKRISSELEREKWGGIKISPNGVYRVLKRHGLQTSAKRLALIAGTAAPPEPEETEEPQEERHLDVSRPGELDDRLSTAWLLLAMTGMRRGEALGLRWRDLSLDQARLSVRQALVLVGNEPVLQEPKTAKGRRSIPLPAETVAALRAPSSAATGEDERRARLRRERSCLPSKGRDAGASIDALTPFRDARATDTPPGDTPA